MYLSTNSQVIRIKADATATTDEATWYTCAKSLDTSTGRLDALVNASGETNGTTPVNIVLSPASGHNRQCVSITLLNIDSVAHSYLVEFYNGSSAIIIHRVSLQPNEKVEYDRGRWLVYSDDGLTL